MYQAGRWTVARTCACAQERRRVEDVLPAMARTCACAQECRCGRQATPAGRWPTSYVNTSPSGSSAVTWPRSTGSWRPSRFSGNLKRSTGCSNAAGRLTTFCFVVTSPDALGDVSGEPGRGFRRLDSPRGRGRAKRAPCRCARKCRCPALPCLDWIVNIPDRTTCRSGRPAANGSRPRPAPTDASHTFERGSRS